MTRRGWCCRASRPASHFQRPGSDRVPRVTSGSRVAVMLNDSVVGHESGSASVMNMVPFLSDQMVRFWFDYRTGNRTNRNEKDFGHFTSQASDVRKRGGASCE